ncbi:unnamed protein product [Ceutorhynchus assimilis]|uniref:Phosphatidic acid phosphatase type 2/haloperoxidase domain-containing protein n=1 Tax=Ceutorhynchus assimilis TaxID=467358 RepID=A0A9P0DLQ9_9CUCU|nr:unnamed protein product [Ceutorhynchus assimilis]
MMNTVIRTENDHVDNKAMVTPLPSTGNAAQPPNSVRLNITDPEKNNAAQPASSRIRFRKIKLAYAINATVWAIVTSCIIVLELGYIPTTKTGFYCKDPALSHSFTGDTISATTLLVSCLLVVPGLVLFLVEYLRKAAVSRLSWRDAWYFYKEYLVGSALVLLITEVAKVLVGEHRPYFLEVCQPDAAQNCTDGQYISTYECTTTKYSFYFMSDTSRSFPSGHSSLSVFAAVYFSYIIQSRLTTQKIGQLFKPFFIACVICWSLVCSLSRITDRRHHWWDVGVGMLLGALGAVYSLSIIYRHLHQNTSIPRVAMSTTTLLDIKNKDAKSEII